MVHLLAESCFLPPRYPFVGGLVWVALTSFVAFSLASNISPSSKVLQGGVLVVVKEVLPSVSRAANITHFVSHTMAM